MDSEVVSIGTVVRHFRVWFCIRRALTFFNLLSSRSDIYMPRKTITFSESYDDVPQTQTVTAHSESYDDVPQTQTVTAHSESYDDVPQTQTVTAHSESYDDVPQTQTVTAHSESYDDVPQTQTVTAHSESYDDVPQTQTVTAHSESYDDVPQTQTVTAHSESYDDVPQTQTVTAHSESYDDVPQTQTVTAHEAVNEHQPEASFWEAGFTDAELLALCKERLCTVCDEKAQADDQRLRSLAEMDNYKKRLAKEQEGLCKYAAELVLADLLPILDNLDLALEHGRKMSACNDVVVGIDMTRNIFLDTLARHGLTPIGEVGECFDPARHEAVAEEARQDLAPGTICCLMQRGYFLRKRLLRPARVSVSKAG
ncbi:molecular chaperone GrpE [Desulfovibrionales bacterium]